MTNHELVCSILSLSEKIRYAALNVNEELCSEQKKGLQDASASESDKYEELIVNPTLLKLVTQRGNIDCGGARYVLIRYGSFFEFVKPFKDGHISVGFQLDADPQMLISLLEEFLER